MNNEDLELLKEFAVESQEHLADIETQLLTLEAQGENMDVALVNTVFRAIHSVKGASAFMGLHVLEGLAHRSEEVLNRLRSKEMRPTSVVINTLLRATDRLKDLIGNLEASNGEDVSDHITALEGILSGRTNIDQADAPAPNKQEISTSQTLNAAALHEFLIEGFDNLEQIERELLALERNPNSEAVLNSIFRSVHTIKGSSDFLGFTKLKTVTHAAENVLAGVRAGKLSFDDTVGERLLTTIDAVRSILHSIEKQGNEGTEDYSDLIAQLETHQDTTPKQPTKAKKPRAKNSKPSVAANDSSTPETPPVKPTIVASPEASPTQAISIATTTGIQAKAPEPSRNLPETTPKTTGSSANQDCSAADSTIRVDVSLLDKLMTCVGELVLARNQLLQRTSSTLDCELHRTSQRLNLITTELQEGVMKTRMQPIGNVWSKFPRLVRDLAVMCEKQVRIEMEGKETELDKTIIEAIKDPLTHLVRNTVDHGIERPEVRLQNGKQAEGCLTLKAYHEGGQVNIEIIDDGAGLNLERIKNKAVERGLMTIDQVSKLADRDVGNLIFLPGFSTAEKVSNVSGRGVGMDVVKTNIEKIGGTVDVQSRSGAGTTIKIRIPLTLAIIPALIVSSDGDRYAIPQVSLLELVRLEQSVSNKCIEWIQGAPVYRLRGRLLPIVNLRSELKLNPQVVTPKTAINIVVLRAEDRQFGLVVDRVNDSEEIVVKPLSKQLKGVPVYSGATIMGDGRVALILDVMGLAQASNVLTGTKDRGHNEASDRSGLKPSTVRSLLVVGVGIEKRCALPIDQVTRLEKIPASSVELADNQEVVQHRGEILPLIRLANALGIEPAPKNARLLDVVVYTDEHRTVGLVIDRIVDIVEADFTHMRKGNRTGVLSSAIIQDQVTDLLDLPAVLNMVAPSFFHEVVTH
jgi:two-component system, chemotaxis family, sensor kinase CheA